LSSGVQGKKNECGATEIHQKILLYVKDFFNCGEKYLVGERF
jgi:hypothetical protein